MRAIFGSFALILSAAAILAQEPGQSLPPPVRTTSFTQERPTPPLEQLPAPTPVGTEKPGHGAGLHQELERLRNERTGLQGERSGLDKPLDETEAIGSADRTRLRGRLVELMLKMAAKDRPRESPASAAAPLVTPTPQGQPAARTPRTEVEVPPVTAEPIKPLDPQALADSLYRAGDYAGALSTYGTLKASKLDREEEIFVQYMTGCCYYQLDRLDDAIAAWREVGSAREDPFLAGVAQWQIGSVRWRREMSQQVQQLRQRREAVEAKR